MSSTNTTSSHLSPSNTNTNTNSSSSLISSSLLFSYSSLSPSFSTSPPIMNSTVMSSTSAVYHPTAVTSTSAGSGTGRPITRAKCICLTRDILTSDANQAFMTVTAHFVDIQNKKIKSFVLVTKEFTGNHTTERIIERLDEIYDEWSIADKVICLVSDTYNTIKKVGKDF
ncbi:unnamed protein product [Rotaria sp. Silwood2]|nr:unnamed protein product [Rotaria sp. Silwood2]